MSTASELSSLVNANRVRSAIRRLFANDIGECFGELFQNSQRAGATAVSVRTFPDRFVYEDDGHGVNTVAGFHALLRLAESDYENPAVEDQHPMGLGIHSLLAHDRVTRVKFESGRLGLEVAAREWWDDPGYYQTWYERLEESAGAAVRGLRVTVFHHPDLAAKVTRTFTGDDYHVSNPARGYRGILKVRVNGAEVDTRLPRWARVRNPLVETAFDGAPLVIGFEGEGRDSSVNFYGQVIRCELAPAGGFAFHLDVRSGRPVNPKSPTRRGVIRDAAYERLVAFVKQSLFDFLFAPENRRTVRPEWVSAFYALDREAARSAPYFVARRVSRRECPGSFQDHFDFGEPEVCSYSEPPPLVGPELNVVLGGQKYEYEYGSHTLLPLVNAPVYHLAAGDRDRLDVKRLWWQPGEVEKGFFHGPGRWGLGGAEREPEHWLPVGGATVYAFDGPSNWDVRDVDWVTSARDRVAFYEREAFAGFDFEHDEYGSDHLENSYRESVEAAVREEIGDCVPQSFSARDLSRFLPTPGSRVAEVRYVYADGKSLSPGSVVVTGEKGERVTLTLR